MPWNHGSVPGRATSITTRLGVVLALCLCALPSAVFAWQKQRVTVVDQTGLPLPGVTIQLLDGDHLVAGHLMGGHARF